MQNDQGVFDKYVYIVSTNYDKVESRWLYTIEDWQRKPIEGEHAELKLRG